LRAAAAALVALGLASCAPREAPPVPPAPDRLPGVIPPQQGIPAPQSYMAVASSIDVLMIRAAELAQTRAGSAALRAFAAKLSQDHFSISSQLSFAGRRLNQLPSGQLLDNHAARLAALQASADFDAVYRTEVRRTLAAAYEYHNRYAQRGDSPTLRPVARYAAGVIARDLDALRRVR
jgi:putative membrane protein